MNDSPVFQVNIREILRSKAPKLYKKIPGVAITLLSKIICEKQLNEEFNNNANLTGVDFMEHAMHDYQITIRLEGTENLPDVNSRCIFASNHPLGGLDGICLSAVLGRKYEGRIRYLVNDILYYIEPLQDIFIPVNKHGVQAKEAVSLLNEAFISENQIITFPAGLCSRKKHGVICDTEWKKMFITKAVEYKRDIVPVYFEARNSNLFYAVANIRKKLGLKFNIEMLLLPREMLRAINSTFTVYFGKPVPWQMLDASKTPQQWANEIKNRVYGRNCS